MKIPARLPVSALIVLCLGSAVCRADTAAAASRHTILLLGDSISAAYGMSLAQGWAALLAQRLAREYPATRLVNASISGETSAGAAARLPALLQRHQPQLVIIELGGNDGLRGYPLARLRDNLQRMAQQSRAAGARVLLLGMRIPPNYGSRYTQQFQAGFAAVAAATDSALVPFLLAGIATDGDLMQGDGIHPAAAAQPLLLERVWPALTALLPAP